MSKYHIPLNLTDFTIENSETTTQEVKNELLKMIKWLKTNQTTYYTQHFTNLINKVKNESVELKGSLNAVARKLDIHPPQTHSYQPYNTAEMFRTSILTKTAGYLQNDLTLEIINKMSETKPLDELTPKEIIKAFKETYPDYKTPKTQVIKVIVQRLLTSGAIHSKPSPDGVLYFWATDTHYSKVTNDNKHIYFSLKLENIGQLTLKFDLPDKDRFKNGKITRPNVFVSKKTGKITFGFTVQKQAPVLMNSRSYLGVDLGKVEAFIGSVITEGTYSAPIHSNKKINFLNKKINKLMVLSSSLFNKEKMNEKRGHQHKYDVLRLERLRIRSKISRLKVERAHYIANQLVGVADAYNANIVFEDLSWVPQGKWDQARVQEFTQDRAKKKGIRVQHVNAKNTSQLCNVCGVQVKHSGRATRCSKCLKRLDRDVLASRNIANKLARKNFKVLVQVSVQTRVSKPVTPGEYNQFSQVSKINNLYNQTE